MSLAFNPSKEAVVSEIQTLAGHKQTAWLILGYLSNTDTNAVAVLGSGLSNLTQCGKLYNIDSVLYCLVKFVQHQDMPAKSGTKVKPKVRAVAPNHKEQVKKLAEDSIGVKMSADFICSTADEFSDDILQEKLFGTGKRQRGMSVRAPVPALNLPKPVTQAANKPAANTIPAQQTTTSTSKVAALVNKASTTTTTTTTTPAPATSLANKFLVGGLKSQLAQILKMNEQAIAEALLAMKQNIRWTFLAYDEDSMLQVKQQGENEGAVEELLPLLNEADVQYIVLRLSVGDSLGYGGDTEKLLLATYIGSEVNNIRRAKVNHHRVAVYNFIHSKLPLSGEYEATADHQFLSLEALREAASGKKGNITPKSKYTFTAPTKPITPRKQSTILTYSAPVGVSATKKAPKALKFEKGEACLNVVNENDALDKLGRLATDSDMSVMWTMFEYDGKSVSDIRLSNASDQRMMDSQAELKPLLADDNLKYLIVKAYIPKGSDDVRTKFLLVVWKGPKIRAVYKAVITNHIMKLKTTINKLLRITNDFTVSTHAELDEVKLLLGDPVMTLDEATKIFGPRKIVETAPSPHATPRNTTVAPSPRNTVAPSPRVPLSKPMANKPSGGSLIVDEQKVIDALKDLQNDETTTNWVMLGYETNTTLFLVGTGTDGVQEFKKLVKLDQINFIFYRVTVQETGYGYVPKVVLIPFIGNNVKTIRAASSASHRISLVAFANKILGISSEYEASVPDDLDEQSIRSKITGIKGGNKAANPPQRMNSASNLKAALNAPQAAPPAQQQSIKKFGGRDSSLKFTDESGTTKFCSLLFLDVKSAFKELRSSSILKWLMFQYDAEDAYKVRIVQRGTGGVENFKPFLGPDQISYIILRLSIIEHMAVAKVIMITWVGENVENFHKARSSGHRINLYEYAKGHISVGGEFSPQSMAELTDEAITAKIMGGKAEQGGDPVSDAPVTRFERVTMIQPKAPEIKKDNFQKEVEFTGKDEIKQALLELVDSANNLDFIKFEVSGKNYRDVKYIDKGTGVLTDAWRDQHLTPTGVYYFVMTVSNSESGYGLVTKHVFVQWTGAQVKALNKNRAGEVRWSLYKYCDAILHLSGELQGCQQPDEVTRVTVLEKISGSRVRGKEMKIEKKDEKFSNLGKDKTEVSFENEDEVDKALASLVEKPPKEENSEEQTEESEANAITWFGVKYKQGSIDKLVFDKSGSGPVPQDFTPELNPNNVYFVVFRIRHAFGYAKDLVLLSQDVNVMKPYYGILQWQGNQLQVLEKALCSHGFHWFMNRIKKKMDKLKACLQGSSYHAEFIEELELERIKKIMRLYD